MIDLVVLVADVQQEKTIQTLLSERYRSLGIRQISYDIYVHQTRDPGVYRGSGAFLGTFARQYDRAMVLLDVEWQGSPGDAQAIENTVQADLDSHGWRNCSVVIALDPELEAWVWSHSPHVPQELGLSWSTIREMGESSGYWPAGEAKPSRPKDLLESILRSTRKRRSSALFIRLALRVGLGACQDRAFVRMRAALREWFPSED